LEDRRCREENNIKIGLNIIVGENMHWIHLTVYGTEVGYFEHGNESSDFIKRDEFVTS